MFFNVPPLERSPRGLKKPALWKRRVSAFNTHLSTFIDAFLAGHSDATVVFVDSYKYFNYFLDHPEQLGYKNVTDYCADNAKPDIDTNYKSYGCLPPEQ